jgi:hypothetical protein
MACRGAKGRAKGKGTEGSVSLRAVGLPDPELFGFAAQTVGVVMMVMMMMMMMMMTMMMLCA